MFGSGVIAENFEVFENDIFDGKVLWMVSKGEWNFRKFPRCILEPGEKN